MNALLAVINRVQGMVFRVLDVLVRAITGLLTRILRRGRHRPWRRGV